MLVYRRAPNIGLDDLGSFWIGPDGGVWELITYCAQPTVSWRNVADPEKRRGGAVGSPITSEFVRLVREEQA